MSKGSGSSTPYTAPNTANSSQSARFIDVISEGPIAGFANGDEYPMKSVFLEDTPIQNPDGTYNFKSITMLFRQGTEEQPYLPTFDVSERIVNVSAEVKKRNPIVRAVTDKNINSLRLTLGVDTNSVTDGSGNVSPAETNMIIELVNNQGVVKTVPVRFTEKSEGQYFEDYVINDLPEVPFNIRIRRISDDNSDERTRNKTYFSSYVETQRVKLSYPHTALAAVSIDSLQFGNNFPRRNYLIKGRIVKIPSNYDPDRRSYDTAVWNGLFKEGWTNNPAWILYDILTQPRFSTVARRIRETDIDKWQLYKIAKYCDELVDDGFGGKEPRFVCNAYISEQRGLGELVDDLTSCFMGMPIWNGNTMSFTVDMPSEPVTVFTNENVVDGVFTYEGVAQKAIHTAVIVQYADKTDSYKSKSEYIANNDAIARYGLNVKKVTSFGCDTRSQAVRYGNWILQSELRQQNTVSFKVGREGLRLLPFDVFTVMDNDFAGVEQAGRVIAVNTYAGGKRKIITLDKAFRQRGWFKITLLSEGKPTVVSGYATVYAGGVSKNEVELSPASTEVKVGDVWVIQDKVKPQQYRAVSVKENTKDGTYDISAVLHDPAKYEAVDTSIDLQRVDVSAYKIAPTVGLPQAEFGNQEVVVKWSSESSEDSIIDYEITVYKDGVILTEPTFQNTPEYRLNNLSKGTYQVVVRARGKKGEFSKPVVKSWTVDYDITNLQTTQKFNAIDLSWNLPQVSVNALSSEVWYGRTPDVNSMKKLATLPYPQNTYTMTGVSVTDLFYFSVRIIDADGNTGEYTPVVNGRSDPDPTPALKQIQGSLNRESLSNELWTQFGVQSSEQAQAESRKLKKELTTKLDAANSDSGEAKRVAQQAQSAANAASSKASQAETKAGQAQTAASQAETKAGQAQTAANAASGKANQAESAANAASGKANQAETKAGQAQDKAEETARALTQLQRGLLSEERVNELIRNSVPSASNASSVLDTRNDNRPPSWYWANYPKQTVSEFKQLSRIGLNLTGIGAYGVLTTETGWSDPTGASITQILRVSDGNVYYRVSDVSFTRNANRTFNYTKDAWSAWNAMETAVSAERRAEVIKTVADNAKKRADEAYKLAEQAKNSAAQNEVTLREIDRKVTQFGKDSQAVATTVANLQDATRSTLTLKTEAQTASGQKVVTGISQTADGITNTTKVTILADKLEVVSANGGNPVQPFVVKTVNGRAQVGINGDLVADGTIQGRHIAAGQTLQSPTIVAGALRMGTFSMNADGSFESSAKEGAAGMGLFQYGLVIRDEKGHIRVVLGNRDKLK